MSDSHHPAAATMRKRRSSLWRYRAGKAAVRLSGDRLRNAAAHRRLRFVDRTIRCPDWPARLDGFHIIHLSDFHLGELLSLNDAMIILDSLRQKNRPVDLIVVTGDVLDFKVDGCEPLLEALTTLPSTLGTFAVLGNHDVLVDRAGYLNRCEQAGLPVLVNTAMELTHRGTPVVLSGIDWARRPDELRSPVSKTCTHRNDHAAHILLAHHPNAFDFAADAHVDLVLSGHTHGGQLNLLHANARRQAVGLGALAHRYSWGVYRRKHSRLHVTSGIGSWFPFRVKCPSEIVRLTIKRGM